MRISLLVLGMTLSSFGVQAAEVVTWPEAERAFASDPSWVGGDVASSIPLAADRILWLFGDSLIDPAGKGRRKGSRMVKNSAALQTGTNPATADLTFHWGRTNDMPQAWLPHPTEASWVWPTSGIRTERGLLLFAMHMEKHGTGPLGFRSLGSCIYSVTNALDLAIGHWELRRLACLPQVHGIQLGSAAVVRDAGHLVAFSAGPKHEVYLARWSEQLALDRPLPGPAWWTGTGWSPDGVPRKVAGPAQSEFSVHYQAERKEWWMLHAVGFGRTNIALRRARALTGPWSEPEIVVRPEAPDEPKIFRYAAKLHPELVSGDGSHVLTYVENAANFWDLFRYDSVYRPRFLKLKIPVASK